MCRLFRIVPDTKQPLIIAGKYELLLTLIGPAFSSPSWFPAPREVEGAEVTLTPAPPRPGQVILGRDLPQPCFLVGKWGTDYVIGWLVGFWAPFPRPAQHKHAIGLSRDPVLRLLRGAGHQGSLCLARTRRAEGAGC